MRKLFAGAEIFKDRAGWRTLDIGMVSFHLFPVKGTRQWGWEEDWHDGPIYSIGVGPLFMVCWAYDSFWQCLKTTMPRYEG